MVCASVVNRIAGFALVALMAVASAATAQSFGRNKVHYDDLDFRILETPHFDIYYYPEEHDASVEAGRLAERWYARLSKALDFTFTARQPIVLYASHSQFVQTNVISGFLGEGTGGVTEHAKGRIVLPFAAGLGETDHVLGHELVHAFQREIIRKSGRSISTLPLWFIEGMAEYLSVHHIDPNTAMWLRDAAAQHRLPRIDQLNDPRWFPYRYGQALWAYLAGRFGDDVIAKCLKSTAKGGAIGRLVAVTGVDVRTLSSGWHESVQQLSAAADSREQTAGLVTSANAGRLNIGPALSPDGRSIVFLSERDQYSIDAFLADATTGAIKRKIVQSAGDPHFESLQFIESAGAWDQSGRRFVLAARSGGQAVLSIFDMPDGGIAREIPIREADQVFGPTWSPDGTRIAFSALKGGLSDLYEVSLETGRVRALTSDAFADLQPSWSPDGRSIVFATDRFSSSLDTLTFGDFRLGAIDVESRAVRELPSVPSAKNIDPHWSRDGASVYFVADAGQVSNVYKLDVASGAIFQVTSEAIGVSGITALSPALSVAAQADRAAFSVYRAGAYEIHTIDLASPPPDLPSLPVVAAATPAGGSGATGPSGASAFSVPGFDLPNGKGFSVKPYRPGLSLDRMIQPYLTAGGGSTGGFVRGGVGLSFGDMLGDHQLQTAVQVGKNVDDFVAEAAYVNMRSRWNWGILGGQVPWLIGTNQPPVTPSADGVLTQRTDVYRQLHRELSGVVIYPFSGAKRLELTGGVEAIAYDLETVTSEFSSVTGRLLDSSTSVGSASPSAALVETGAALVYDTAVFGPTSPILGRRYRFAVAPTFGSLSFTTVTADVRRYVMPVRPLTIAMRVMHVGRYGSGADDPRLLPLVWTLRDVVRGYGDTGPDAGSHAYLSADRMVVANVEARFPIPGIFTGSPQPGALPIEGLIFSDAGKFWSPGTPASSRPLLRSVGAGVRLSAAGVIFELDAVRPLDQTSGWSFAFNFRPGF